MRGIFGLKEWSRDLKISLMFLTRFPLKLEQEEAKPLAHCLRAFPIVGLIVGAFSGLAYLIAFSVGLSPFLSALIAVATGVLVTGALHEDGLADCADGFGGGWSRERKLKIMRDSRMGAYGGLSLVFSIALRAGALAQIAAPGPVFTALLTAHAASRFLPALALFLLPPVRAGGLGAAAGRPSDGQVFQALLFVALLLGFMTGLSAALICLLVLFLSGFAWCALAKKQVGGQSGDILGGAQQIGEISLLLTLAALS